MSKYVDVIKFLNVNSNSFYEECKLSKIIEKYATVPVSSVKNIETSHYTNLLSDCRNSLETVQNMLTAQERINGLFGKPVVVGDTVLTNVAIKDDLKADNVETAKNSYYKKGSKSEWQRAINTLLEQADEQLKQIEKSKQMLEKVFKDNKVINIDKENYDSAKTEIDKIKNEKIKNELSERLKQVQNEIDKQEKERIEKEKTEQTPAKEETTVQSEIPVQSDSTDSQPVVSENAAEPSVPVQTETPNNNWVPDTGNSSGTVSIPAPTPPTNNGSGSTGGGANSSNSSSGNGQTGGNQGNTTPTQPTVPSEPEQPAGPPAGWIVSPYPIDSQELWDWLWNNGYSGYDHSGGYIRPY